MSTSSRGGVAHVAGPTVLAGWTDTLLRALEAHGIDGRALARSAGWRPRARPFAPCCVTCVASWPSPPSAPVDGRSPRSRTSSASARRRRSRAPSSPGPACPPRDGALSGRGPTGRTAAPLQSPPRAAPGRCRRRIRGDHRHPQTTGHRAREVPVVIVFVHGVPETAAIWTGVRAALDEESVALSLPGFGCPRPDGFAATKDDYRRLAAGRDRRHRRTGRPGRPRLGGRAHLPGRHRPRRPGADVGGRHRQHRPPRLRVA